MGEARWVVDDDLIGIGLDYPKNMLPCDKCYNKEKTSSRCKRNAVRLNTEHLSKTGASVTVARRVVVDPILMVVYVGNSLLASDLILDS